MAELRRKTPSTITLYTAGALEQGRNGSVVDENIAWLARGAICCMNDEERFIIK